MASVESIGPVASLGLGATLSAADPKTIALTAAAAASVAQADLSRRDGALAMAVFVAIGSLTVVGPVVVALAAPERAAGPLDATKRFMSEHRAVVMVVVLVLLGARLVGDGLAGLGGRRERRRLRSPMGRGRAGGLD